MRLGLGCGLGRLAPLRPNLITSPNDLTNVAWSESGTTVAAHAGTNPLDGTNTAFGLVEDSSTGAVHQVSQVIAGASLTGIAVNLSVYVKAAGRTEFAIGGSGGASVAWFDVSGGTVGTVAGGSASISSLGGGWFHASFTYTGSGGVPNVIVFYSSNANGSVLFNGNGATALLLVSPTLQRQ